MEVTSLPVIVPAVAGILTWLRPSSHVCPPCSVTCPQVTCGSLTCSGSPSTTTGLNFIAILIALVSGVVFGALVRVPNAWVERSTRRVEKALPCVPDLDALTESSAEQRLTVTPKTRVR